MIQARIVISRVEMMLALLVVVSLWIDPSQQESLRRVVTVTPYGKLVGQRRTEDYNIGPGAITDTVDQWLGVKYGQAQRWQSSTFPDVSDEEFEALDPYPSCPQVHYYQHTYITNQYEDCLMLNIHSPVSQERVLYPVMVFIHGGSYEEGTGMRYDGFSLATHGVVVVTINYRLAQLGYLTSGSSELPGNFGLGDQVLALNYIKENIHRFGGNASSVTLFGSSAGAASIGLIMTIPETEGLFHGAILQSGSPLSYWAVHGAGVKFAAHVAEVAGMVGCGVPGLARQLACMRRVDQHVFSQIHWSVGRYSPSGLNYKPWVDGKLLQQYPHDAFAEGRFHKVPVMTGFVSNEWARNAGFFYSDLDSSFIDAYLDDGMERASFIKAIHHVVTTRMGWPDHVVDIIVQLYTNYSLSIDDPIANRDKYVEWMGDISMYGPAIQLADLLIAQNVPVYMYEFEHTSMHTPVPWWGTYHSLELDYVFGSPFNSYNLAIDDFANHTEADRQISRTMMNLWTNFAKSGNPNKPDIKPSPVPQSHQQKSDVATTTNNNNSNATTVWHSYNSINHSYLYISVGKLIERYNYKSFAMTFWNEFLPKLLNIARSAPDAQPMREACWQRHAVVWVLTVLVIVLAFLLAFVFVAYYASQKRARKMKIIYTTSPEARKCLA